MSICHLFLREEEGFHQLRLHSAALLQVEYFCHYFLSGRFMRCTRLSVVFTSKVIFTSTTDVVPQFVQEAEGLLLQTQSHSQQILKEIRICSFGQSHFEIQAEN